MTEENVQLNKLHVNLRGSQIAFLHNLSFVLAIDDSEVFKQLIDLAMLPELERKNHSLHNLAVQYEVLSGSRSRKSGRWKRFSIYLDDIYIARIESLMATSGASRSGVLRHLLADYKEQSSASLQSGKSALWNPARSLLPGGRFGSVIAVVLVLAIAFATIYFSLSKGISIEYAPHWGGDHASIILDHHTHTRYSDGALTARELVDVARAGGCDALVISDHADKSGTLSDEQFQELRNLRLQYPELLLFAGVELNMPFHGGREHVGIIADPAVENETLRNLQDIAELTLEENASGTSALPDSDVLQMFDDYQSRRGGLLLVYNHPSANNADSDEIISNLKRWNADAPLVSLLAGAPGHQNAPAIGQYKEPRLTVDRWDPVVADIGGAWDRLWLQGYQIWGALASSGYYNERLDKAPCAFSRTHVAVPERSYRGVIKGLNRGTFWADHGRILDQLWFAVGMDGLEQLAYPGSTIYVGDRNSTALINLSVERGPGSLGSPLLVEIIGNCGTGSTETLAEYVLSASSSAVSGRIDLRATGRDRESCFLRARVRLVKVLGADLLAYTNPVKLRL